MTDKGQTVERDTLRKLDGWRFWLERLVMVLFAVFAYTVFAHAQVYEHSTIWGDTAKTWTASWNRSLCGSVQCVEEHYVVRVTHLESGLQAFPDIVTAVGVVSVQFQLPRSGHYIVWVKAVNPIGESAWAKLEEGINTAVQYQPRGAWLYTQPAAPSF